MKRLLLSTLVWILVCMAVIIIVKFLGGSELLQGMWGAIVAIHVERNLFPDWNLSI